MATDGRPNTQSPRTPVHTRPALRAQKRLQQPDLRHLASASGRYAASQSSMLGSPMKTSVPRAAGFTLLEALIVIVVMLATLLIGVAYWRDMQKRMNNDNVVATEARELSQITNAVVQYVNANKSTWAAGSTQTITIANLIAAGKLPTAFGNRTGTDGETPLGQQYRIVAIVDAANSSIVRTVVTETGSMLVSRLDRGGVSNTTAGMTGVKDAMGQRGQSQFQLVCGTIGAATTSATGVLKGWTKDLSAWIGTAPTQPLVVSMVGFPDLGGPGNPDPNAPKKYSNCSVVKAFPTGCTPDNVGNQCGYGYGNVTPGPGAGTFSQSRVTCGTRTEVGSFPYCANFAISSTDVGTLTSASRTESGTYTDNCATGNHAYSDNFTDTTLNNVTILTEGCGGQRWYQQQGPPTCLYQLGYTTPNQLVTGGGGKNLLCCDVR